MRSPIAAAVFAFVAGVAAGVNGDVPALHSRLMTAVVVGALTVVVRTQSATVRRLLVPVLLCVAGVQHGANARDAALHSSLRSQLEATVGEATIDRVDVIGRHEPFALRAVLTEDAAEGAEFASLRVRAEELLAGGRWQPAGGGLVLTINGAADRDRIREWRAGRTIEVPVTFRRPTRYLNDGVPDFERDAALSGISLFGSVKSALLVEVVRRGSVIQEGAADIRAAVRAAVARWTLPHGQVPAAIVTAVLIGDRTGLPDDVRIRLQAAGTYHVIAISGGNIAILSALILVTGSLMGVRGRYTAAAAMTLLVTYAGTISAGPSVWRATLMALLYFGARLFDLRTPPWHAMTLTAGVITVVQPLDVRDAGFLLTFGATAGLLGMTPLMTTWRPQRWLLAWLLASVAASVAAEAALLPVAASVFSRVTAAGLLLNLIAVPAMAMVQVAGMVVVAFHHVGVIALPAGVVAARGASALVESARLVDLVPALVLRVPPPAAWIVVAYYAALIVAWRSRSHLRIAGGMVLALVGVLIITGSDPLAVKPRAEVMRMSMLDVGQAESILLQVPGAARRATVGVDPQETLLIDAGGSPFDGGAFDIGARVLAPALWSRGVRRLGTLLVTHGDPDHLGGAGSVVSDFRPRTVWWGTPVPPHPPSREFLDVVRRQGRAVGFRRAGEQLPFGAARIRVLHPPSPDWERQKVRNDDSVVLEITYGDVALLLTGDISAAIERQIAPQLTPARLRILKVAHHGSRTSTSQALLDAWRPQVALISCGRGNTFGHPAADVLARLASIGARVYRTDRDGEITVETDGRSLSITTFTGGQP